MEGRSDKEWKKDGRRVWREQEETWRVGEEAGRARDLFCWLANVTAQHLRELLELPNCERYYI